MFLRTLTVALACFGLAAAQTCGGSFTLDGDNALTITSPGYPTPYDNNMNCVYTVSTEAVEGYKGMEINSNDFNTENTYDCLEIKDADGSVVGKFCGTSGPEKARVSGSTFTMTFKSDSSVTRPGWSIRVSRAKCRKGEGSCPNHPDVCMASNAWCNGVNDCPDAADEKCPEPGSCGQSIARPNNRIVGGQEAEPNAYPWQVAMMSNGGSQICGGTIIDPFWIMTAAHCCAAYSPSPSNYKFRIGAHNYAANEDGASTITCEKLIMHPSYNSPKRYANDFCLCKTSERMQLSHKVQPACITSEEVPVDATVRVTGWGNTGANKGDFDDFIRQVKDIESGRIPKGVANDLVKGTATLREVDVKTVTNEFCNTAYSNGISEDMLCAAAPGKDSCQGDSGGPLTYHKDGKWYLHGVVSWGRGCAQPAYPGVYGRMSEVYPWIAQSMASN